jgi:hypothetical protein
MKVIFVFYLNFVVPSVVVSLLIGAFIRDGSASEIMAGFWAKLITSGLLGLFFWFFHSDKFYFFENLGFTKRWLHAGALAIDLTFWLVITSFFQFI